MTYKLLATDIDGTITDEIGRIHIRAMEWIRRLEEKGIPVVLVSGRPLPFLESLSLYLGTSGPLIAENGGVAKLGGEIILFGNAEPARIALSELQKAFKLELDDDNHYRLVDISIKKSIDPESIKNFIEEKGLPVSILVTNVMLHLVDIQVSKGKTLLEIIRKFGLLPSEIVVCGDSFNDLPLFEIGALNLTVANGEYTLKKKANLVAKASYGAGFSELVEILYEKFNSFIAKQDVL